MSCSRYEFNSMCGVIGLVNRNSNNNAKAMAIGPRRISILATSSKKKPAKFIHKLIVRDNKFPKFIYVRKLNFQNPIQTSATKTETSACNIFDQIKD